MGVLPVFTTSGRSEETDVDHILDVVGNASAAAVSDVMLGTKGSGSEKEVSGCGKLNGDRLFKL